MRGRGLSVTLEVNRVPQNVSPRSMKNPFPDTNFFFHFLIFALPIMAVAFLGYIQIVHLSFFDDVTFNPSRQRSQLAAVLPVPSVGTWTTIPNSAIWPVIPPEAKTCPTTNPNCGTPELWSPWGIFAYSGGDLATLSGKLGFVFWGGGHGDSPDNSLYFSAFDGSGPARLSGPYLAPDRIYKYDDGKDIYRSVSRNQPAITVAAAPKSRHTYSSIISIDIDGKPYLFVTGGSLTSGSGGGTNATRLFDLSQTYAQAMARADMGWALMAPSPAGGTVTSSGWDSQRKVVVTRGFNSWGVFNPKTNTWVRVAEAVGGSDYEASVAVDVVGRKMYVLGNKLAEVINLDTYVVTRIGTWDGTKVTGPEWVRGFVTPYWLPGGYLSSGVQWHPGRKRIIAYANTLSTDGTEQNLLQIDPVGNTIEKLSMGGVSISTKKTFGIYGRFRLIPGTDTVILAGAVDTNIFIGQLPASSSSSPPPSVTVTVNNTVTQPPPPVVSGQITLPVGKWFAIRSPAMFSSGVKHMTGALNPDNGRIYWTGGDHGGAPFTVPDRNGSYRQETYSLSLAEKMADPANPISGWRLEYPYCGPTTGIQPKHPDYVGWTWDRTRHKFWMVPGEMVTSGDNCPNETPSGTNDPAFPFGRIMTFDPVAKTWANIGSAQAWGSTWGAVHDSVSDTIIRFRWDGGWGSMLGIYHVGTNTWEDIPLSRSTSGTNIRDARIDNSVTAADYVSRVIYTYDYINGHFYRYHMDSRAVDDLGPSPGGPILINYQAVMVWDSVNSVLLWYHVAESDLNTGAPLSNGAFWAYHPNTKVWEELSLETNLPSVRASALVMAFDEKQNAVVMIPRAASGYMYLYRYAPGGPPIIPPPPSDTQAPTVSLSAPANGVTVSGTITVSANASDNIGVAGVQFKLDGANLGAEDTSSPYSVSWTTTNASNASHTLTATARDQAGNQTTSPSITVTVNNSVTPPPAQATNIALNKPTTASSPCSLNETSNKAVNGSVSGGNSDKFCSLALTKWHQVDLGAIFSLSQIILKHAGAGRENSNWNTYDFDVAVSADAVTWTTVARVRANRAHTTTHQISPVISARYSKITVITSEAPASGGTGAMRLYEHEIYGSTVTQPPPPTAPPPPLTDTQAPTIPTHTDSNLSGQSAQPNSISATPLQTVTPPPVTNPPPTLVFQTSLYLSLRHPEVTLLQRLLISRGLLLSGNDTGFYGPLTQEAVRKFQCQQNIVCGGRPEDTGYGLVGPRTRERLNQIGSTPSTSSGQASSSLSDTQRRALIQQLTEQIKQLQIQLLQLQLKLLQEQLDGRI